MARQYFRGVLGKNCKFQFNVILVMRSTWKFFLEILFNVIYICMYPQWKVPRKNSNFDSIFINRTEITTMIRWLMMFTLKYNSNNFFLPFSLLKKSTHLDLLYILSNRIIMKLWYILLNVHCI